MKGPQALLAACLALLAFGLGVMAVATYTQALADTASARGALKVAEEEQAALQDAAQGKTFQSENSAKTAFNAAGYAFGLPTGQAWTTIDYLKDKVEGEEEGFDPVEAFVSDRR